jgi:hypothetical protein
LLEVHRDDLKLAMGRRIGGVYYDHPSTTLSGVRLLQHACVPSTHPLVPLKFCGSRLNEGFLIAPRRSEDARLVGYVEVELVANFIYITLGTTPRRLLDEDSFA